MLVVTVAVVVTLLVAGLVVVYVAYPHRGEQVPGLPWLGKAMQRAAGAAPVIEDDERDLIRLR
ncbi:hypothetical protein JK386_11000 [Nocardioides sp. zg-536]|uniref:Uncharacterized protein n=1 Tax=Nocardioides faecalis TaxID=2803858 RepID=A0A938Y737_9ACTN|nr:hypothetical protein [Nocardioides faecalis]MBM9460432.1 hypothetical protein [Nocardioides faecalis]MBS4751357.1 hypothetical protein [Nocardioides faecalis]QVI59746.1 hypothetical protein KG111_05260 [Nocardioides faecalis]